MKPGSFICLMAAGLLFISCNQKQSSQQTNPGASVQNNNGNNASPSAVNGDSLSASWYVKGCARDANKEDREIPSKGEVRDYPDLPMPVENSIKAERDSIIYNRYVSHGCCRKVKVNTEKQGNVITITEYWWGQICKCMCSSDVTAVIRQLPKGVYQVYAVETGTDPFDDKPANGRDTVMSQKVIIK
jgi:hypothetical protein